MKLVSQPHGSKLCGQACIAMIADVSLDEACLAIGHCGATTGTDLLRGLGRLCVQVGPIVRNTNRTKPPVVFWPKEASRSIARLHWPNDRGGHWVVIWDDEFFDPASPSNEWPAGTHITSYIRIS